MKSMRFIENEAEFLKYSWTVYQLYFNNQDSFIDKYNHIATPDKKNSFLRLTSYYFFLVINGEYSSSKSDELDLSSVDQTFKFIAISALIESMYEDSDFIDFYDWLMRNKNKGIFPIKVPEEATKLHEAYLQEYGSAVKFVIFFQSLDDSVKAFLNQSIKFLEDTSNTGELDEMSMSIPALSRLLYQIRSDFVHNTELVLEFDSATVLSVRKKKPIVCYIELTDLCHIFEIGLLKYFNITPDKSII